jgi:DNA (cytosine-5)-methyltransferase 1
VSPLKHPLRQVERPSFEEGEGTVRLVDLFCGCGGLSLGIAQALREHDIALDVTLAVDTDEDALSVYRGNFPKATISHAAVESLIDGTVGGKWMTATETTLLKEVDGADVLVAGPPCQGHSDLNNHTRRVDP